MVRHDHVRAPADPDAFDIDAARGEHVEFGQQGRRVDHDAVADDRGDVRVEHPGRGQAELEDLVPAHDRVAGVVAALVADDHGHLFGEEVGGLALPLVAPLEADDDRRRHQPFPRAARERQRERKKPPAGWPGTWLVISRVAPPMPRRIAIVWSPGRLAGRPMRPASAIADLRSSRTAGGPCCRGRAEYSRGARGVGRRAPTRRARPHQPDPGSSPLVGSPGG